jgi:hypothetical protein
MESSPYLTLPMKKRRILLVKMAVDYPFLAGESEQKEAVGYEASLAGIFRTS